MKNYSIIYLIIALLFAACKKDVVEFIPNEVETSMATYVMTDLGGKVMDENNTPLASVTIEINTKNGIVETSTDENGIFLTRNIEVRQDRLYVKARAQNYFLGSKTIEVAGNAIENIEIKLLEQQFNDEFNSNVGGVITTNEGAKVTFGPNVIADSNGNPYSGNVLVAARWLNPTSADIFHIMPGNLIGEDSTGRQHVMATAGMMAVELFSDNFDQLNILEGKTAELEFPIPSSIINVVPTTIPLWSFDENKGIWLLEGEAQLSNNQYLASVTHFSFWNCDALFPIVNGQGKVVDLNGNPVANALVKVAVNGLNSRSGWTNSEGIYSGDLPANSTLEISVCNACGDPLGTPTIVTTSDADLTIPDIAVAQSMTITNVFGSVVDCDDMPVTNGYVSITSGTIGQHLFLDANGQFNNTFLYCTESTLKVVAVDIDNEKMSLGDTFSIAPMIDVDTIKACDDLAEFIRFDLDGVSYLYGNPVSVTGGISATEGLNLFDASQGFSLFAENSDVQVNQSFPITFLMVEGITVADYMVNVELSETGGGTGDEMVGIFNGTFTDNSGSIHSIDGDFKVIRDF